jgi:hypothetical protein
MNGIKTSGKRKREEKREREVCEREGEDKALKS